MIQFKHATKTFFFSKSPMCVKSFARNNFAEEV